MFLHVLIKAEFMIDIRYQQNISPPIYKGQIYVIYNVACHW